MKKTDIIELLKQYPDDVEIEIMGFIQDRCGSWEAWHSPKLKHSYDEKYNELYLEGDLCLNR